MLLVEAPVSATLTAAQEEWNQKQEPNHGLLRLKESRLFLFTVWSRWSGAGKLYEAYTTEEIWVTAKSTRLCMAFSQSSLGKIGYI